MKVTAWRADRFGGTHYEEQGFGPVDTVCLDGLRASVSSALSTTSGSSTLPDQLPTTANPQSNDSNWYRIEIVAGNQGGQVNWDDDSEVPEEFYGILALLTRPAFGGGDSS
jgi:hypothetical protein